MTALWMAYLLLVGTLVAAGAWGAEGLARLAGRPTRWPWAAGLALLLVTAVLAPRTAPPEAELALPSRVAVAMKSPESYDRGAFSAAVARLDEARLAAAAATNQAIARAAASVPRWVAPWLGAAWLLLSAALVALLATVYLRVRRARAAWPRETLHGTPVRVTTGSGPAVVGLANPEIVVPRWLFREDDATQRLVLAHEREHLRTRDPLLLAAACGAAALLPWHPAAWWMLARLRLAVEVDCDRRVLGGGAPAGRYGALLIDLAGHDSMLPLGAPALADRRTHLERRLLAMTAPASRFPLARGAALVALAGAALLAACEARVPTAAEVEGMDVAAVEQRAQQMKVAGGPTAYVVDGIEVSAEEARAIPAERIASVQVLKATMREDATPEQRAAAPSRILITTKAHATGETANRAMLRQSSDSARVIVSAIEKPAMLRTTADGPGPVFYIDGVRADAAKMKAISPAAIESIEVLKGEAARKAYGAEGANGVIVVTTKKQ